MSDPEIKIKSASAGSGKTHFLADFLANEVSEGTVQPDKILGTTFTRKAAKELQERVRSRLLEQGRLAEAQRLAASRIGTVNAVCGALVGDFAFELGLSPGVEVLEEALADDEFERALADSLSGEDRKLSEIEMRLSGIPKGKGSGFEWRKNIADLCAKARSNGRTADDVRADGERARAEFLELFGARSKDPHTVQLQPVLDALETFVAEVTREIAAHEADGKRPLKNTGDALAAARNLRIELGREAPRWHLLLGTTKKIVPQKELVPLTEPVFEALSRFLDHSSRLQDDVIEAIDRVYAVAANALDSYQQRKRERGVLDFSDQEAYALQLLRNKPEVRDELREQLDLVLVDEFQDTSPIQLAIFLELSWLAKHSVWVGDQKQAIFGFRGADPSLMDAALRTLGQNALDDSLRSSWRSRPQLVELTSELFAAAFPSQDIPAEHVRLESARAPEPPGLGPVVERWVLVSKKKESDAQALAAGVAELLADDTVRVWDKVTREVRPPTPGDVAILCRLNDTANLVAAELEAQGIRAVLPRDGLLDTAEGTVALAALRLVADPRDSLAIALLSRFLAGTTDPDAWLSKLLKEKYARSFAELDEVAALQAVHDEHPQAGALQAFDAAIEAVKLYALCARWGKAELRRANLERLRAHAEAYVAHSDSVSSGCTPTGLIAYLEKLAGDGDSQATLASADAVQVSTWHRAKGLEWPITVLYELPYVPRSGMAKAQALGVHVASDTAQISLLDPLAGRWLRYWPNPFAKGQKGTRFHDRLERHAAELEAEKKIRHQELRLLYVGWTRARDRVVLAARDKQLAEGLLTHLADTDGPLIDEPGPQATWAGVTVEVKTRRLEPADPVTVEAVADTSYTCPEPTVHPAAYISPSKIEAGAATTHPPETIGERIPLAGDPDMASLGEAVHGFLAADPGAGHPSRDAVCRAVLDRWEVTAHIEVAPVVAAADALAAWLTKRWPDARWLREWPIHHRLDDGSIVRGFIDLVLETAEGHVVIDHKSFPGSEERAMERAARYAGQLGAYGDGIEAATGRPIVGLFINLPISGKVVEVTRS